MYIKIVPTSKELRKGRIKVRADFYLDPDDARYNECYVQVPESWEDFKKWTSSLLKDKDGFRIFPDPDAWYGGYPGKRMWVNTPFLGHLFYIDDAADDKAILDLAEGFAKTAYAHWESGLTKLDVALRMPVNAVEPIPVTSLRRTVCDTTMERIAVNKPERKDIKR